MIMVILDSIDGNTCSYSISNLNLHKFKSRYLRINTAQFRLNYFCYHIHAFLNEVKPKLTVCGVEVLISYTIIHIRQFKSDVLTYVIQNFLQQRVDEYY